MKVDLFSKEFSYREMEDAEYDDTIAIKCLLESREIPYEEFANKSHLGDPRVKFGDEVYEGIKEIRDNLLVLTDYFHPERRS